MTEQCWILTGGYDEEEAIWTVNLCRHISGDPASVEADWEWTLSREEDSGDILGFAHTHPAGANTLPSSRDIRTMRVWCSALGKPLLCLIGAGDELGVPAGYIFNDDQSDGVLTTAFSIADL